MEKEDRSIDDWIYSYFSGELSEEETARLWQWIEADEINKRYFTEKADWWATVHVPYFRLQMNANFQKHFGNLQSRVDAVKRSMPGRRNLWVRLVASVLLMLATGLAGYYVGKDQIASPWQASAGFETTVPLGSRSKVVLPDHTVVWINAGSTLKYNGDFNRQTREVRLAGEAYFEVTSDSLKPFVVKSDQLDIRVMGTRFNVKAYEEDEKIDVALVDGRVRVHLNGRKPEEAEVALTPDRLLSYHKETHAVQLKKIKGSDAYGWMNGRLKFDHQPFPQIARDLERKFNVKIHIRSQALKEEIFSGSFSADHSLQKILREIDVDKKYMWTRKENEWTIRDK